MSYRSFHTSSAAAALAIVVLFVSPARAQLEYQTYTLTSKARVHSRVEGTSQERTQSQILTFAAPLPPQRFNFNGPAVEAPATFNPAELNASGTIFPQHVEMRPELFDWGNEYFIRVLNHHSEQARAQAQFDTKMAMTFTVASAQEYTVTARAQTGPLEELSAIGEAHAYDFRLFRGPIPMDLSSRSAPPFNVQRTFLLEPGVTYRLEFETLALMNITGFGAGGTPVEAGLRGNVSLMIQPVIPEPATAAMTSFGLALAVTSRRSRRWTTRRSTGAGGGS